MNPTLPCRRKTAGFGLRKRVSASGVTARDLSLTAAVRFSLLILLLLPGTSVLRAVVTRELPLPSSILSGPQFGSQRNPALAFNGEVLMVAWDDLQPGSDRTLKGQRFSPGGEPIDPAPFLISAGTGLSGDARHPAIAALPGGDFLIAWEMKSQGVFIAAIPHEGAPGAAVRALGVGDDVEVSCDGEHFLVCWHQNLSPVVSGNDQVMGTRVTLTEGGMIAEAPAPLLQSAREPVVTGGAGGRHFLAALSDIGIHWTILDLKSWPPGAVAEGAFPGRMHTAASDGGQIWHAALSWPLNNITPQALNLRRISWSGGMLGDTENLPLPGTLRLCQDLAAAVPATGKLAVVGEISPDPPVAAQKIDGGGGEFWMWSAGAAAGNGVSGPVLLPSDFPPLRQDPEIVAVGDSFQLAWEDRRIDYNGGGNSDQEDIYLQKLDPAALPQTPPEKLLTHETFSAPWEPGGLIHCGDSFLTFHTQPMTVGEGDPPPGTRRRVIVAGGGGAPRVIGFSTSGVRVVQKPAGGVAVWDFPPYRKGKKDTTGLQMAALNAAGHVEFSKYATSFPSSAGGAFGAGENGAGFLMALDSGAGPYAVLAVFSPSSDLSARIEEVPGAKQPLGLMFNGSTGAALWKEIPLSGPPRTRVSLFRQSSEGIWRGENFLPGTLPLAAGDVTDTLGLPAPGPVVNADIPSGLGLIAIRDGEWAKVQSIPLGSGSYNGFPDTLFACKTAAGGTVRDVRLLPLTMGAMVLVMGSDIAGTSALHAQRIHSSLACPNDTASLLWTETGDWKIVGAAASESREIQVLIQKTGDPAQVRFLSCQIRSPEMVVLPHSSGRLFHLTGSGEPGWRYLVEESPDLMKWSLSGSALGGEEGMTWSQGIGASAMFFRLR